MSGNQDNIPNNPVVENTVQNPQPQTNTNYNNSQNTNNIPSQYRPLSAWAYFGYQLLFAIPLVGFIMLIVFAFDDSNLNRRNFARSYFCGWLIALIILVIVAIIVFAILGVSLASFSTASGSSINTF